MESAPESGQTIDTASTTDTATALAVVTAERDQLAADKADLQDRLLRRQAEFENIRRRADREKAEFLEYASMEAVRSMLPLIDDLDRALKIETQDKNYAKGMELIAQRFLEQLKRLGLEPIESAGKPFDPHIHHAVEMFETTDAPDHTVLEEYQRGYNFKQKLLRPAMVKVAVNPSSSTPSEEAAPGQ